MLNDPVQGTDKVIEIFKERGALLSGHFKLASGMHSDTYFQCAKIFESPQHGNKLCNELAAKWNGVKFDVIVGPAYGGIIISYELARIFGVKALFLERVDGRFSLRRGFKIEKGDKVLIAEDVVTTGGSSYEVAEILNGLGAQVIGTSCLVFRGNDYRGDLRYLAKVNAASWEPSKCPLCIQGVPIQSPGQVEPNG